MRLLRKNVKVPGTFERPHAGNYFFLVYLNCSVLLLLFMSHCVVPHLGMEACYPRTYTGKVPTYTGAGVILGFSQPLGGPDMY